MHMNHQVVLLIKFIVQYMARYRLILSHYVIKSQIKTHCSRLVLSKLKKWCKVFPVLSSHHINQSLKLTSENVPNAL